MNAQLQTIDAAALADPAERINEQHRLAISHRDSAIQHAAEAGRILLQVKQRLAHGEFMPWIEINCDFARSTATRYMAAAEQIATGVAISSLRALFPSGRAPAKVIGSEKAEKPAATAGDAPTPSPKTDYVSPEQTSNGSETVGEPSLDDGDALSPEEIAQLEAEAAAFEREREETFAKLLLSDDALRTANEELTRKDQEIAGLKVSRNGFMNGKEAICKLLKIEQAKVKSLGRKLDAANAKIARKEQEIANLRAESERLRERIAIMEESA